MEDIIAQYNHSKFGNYCFNLCAKWTKFIVKHKILFYILSFTWGIIMSLVGLLASLVLEAAMTQNADIQSHKFLWSYFYELGERWGGVTFGHMFICDKESVNGSIPKHEFGHVIQNTLFGPLMPILVCIPSALRYWYMTIYKINLDYDAFWVEDAATQCGEYAYEYLK